MDEKEVVVEDLERRVKQCTTTQQMIAVYDDWAATYDQSLDIIRYNAPTVVADALEKYLEGRMDVKILDVAAGTGQVGLMLNAKGFKQVDALDPSKQSLVSAREKNIYGKLIEDFFPCQKDSVADSSYDIVTCVGGIALGCLKCDCLAEMIRCVKPGGLVVIEASERFVMTLPEYKDRLEPLMEQLEQEGQWRRLERSIIRVYHNFNGILWVFKVTKDSGKM